MTGGSQQCATYSGGRWTGVPPANAAQPMPFFTNLIASYAQHVVVVDGSWLTGLGNDLSNPLLRITQSSLPETPVKHRDMLPPRETPR